MCSIIYDIVEMAEALRGNLFELFTNLVIGKQVGVYVYI